MIRRGMMLKPDTIKRRLKKLEDTMRVARAAFLEVQTQHERDVLCLQERCVHEWEHYLAYKVAERDYWAYKRLQFLLQT